MNRREFLAGALIHGIAPSWFAPLRAADTIASDGADARLRGFIVSDAHFGWQHEQQPAPELQREMMRRILRRHPDLDLLIDTGDAHHSGADDDARGRWTEIIAGGCNTLPFYYIAGNHEIIPTMGLDPEFRCNQLGSVSCRPYYSFNLKGIHFVALPEMKRAVYVDRETREWLELDLEVHRDQTTLILTHNNILGRTCPKGEFGYRGLANSEAMLALLDRFPNVVAWMNGHNHTYEVEQQEGRLYVSNGRIGGFIPPEGWGRVGQGHLGGIYFEIDGNGLAVRSYSATADKYMDEMGDAHLSGRLTQRTTFDPQVRPSYCFGYGGMRDGQRIPVYNHHASADGAAELFLMGTDGPSFNDDPSFALYQRREHATLGPHHQLMNASVQLHPKWQEMWVENDVYEWLDPGIRFLARAKPTDVTRMTVPLVDHGRATCYRCPPGERYQAAVDIESRASRAELHLEFAVHDRNQKRLAVIPGPFWSLKKGRQRLHTTFQVPPAARKATIYEDQQQDNTIHLMMTGELSGLDADVVLHRFTLALADAEGPTRDAGLISRHRSVTSEGPLRHGTAYRHEIAIPETARTIYQVKADGNRRVSWLIRHADIRWQVRNAPVACREGVLEVGPMRNTFSDRAEIVIVPMERSDTAFVHRLRGVDLAGIRPLQPGSRELVVTIARCRPGAEVDIVSPLRPAQVRGCRDWHWQRGRLRARVGPSDTMRIMF